MQAEIDQRELERLKQRLTQVVDTDFVVCREGQILGTFWFQHHAAHPLLGAYAGLNIILQPEPGLLLKLFAKTLALLLAKAAGVAARPSSRSARTTWTTRAAGS